METANNMMARSTNNPNSDDEMGEAGPNNSNAYRGGRDHDSDEEDEDSERNQDEDLYT